MGTTRKVLLADDDASIRVGVADLLETLDLIVLQAETGAEAIELAREVRVHAALLDMQMPELSGLDALARLRDEFSGLPCILYSGALTPATAEMATTRGAFAVLKKPVAPHLLRAEVLRALDHSPYLN